MKIVILCGGGGTRIRDVADNITKPMIPIGESPILRHIKKGDALAAGGLPRRATSRSRDAGAGPGIR